MKSVKTLFFFLLFSTPEIYGVELSEVFLLNKLDEDRSYCLDIKGYKNNAKIARGLQAHTCYSYKGEVSIDQGFSKNKLSDSVFFIPGFSVCMVEKSYKSVLHLILDDCSVKRGKGLRLTEDGRISPLSDLSLCVTVSHGAPRKGKGGNPVHLMRDISLEKCNKQNEDFQLWGFR